MRGWFVLCCSADTAGWKMLEHEVTSGVISVPFNNVKVVLKGF